MIVTTSSLESLQCSLDTSQLQSHMNTALPSDLVITYVNRNLLGLINLFHMMERNTYVECFPGEMREGTTLVSDEGLPQNGQRSQFSPELLCSFAYDALVGSIKKPTKLTTGQDLAKPLCARAASAVLWAADPGVNKSQNGGPGPFSEGGAQGNTVSANF